MSDTQSKYSKNLSEVLFSLHIVPFVNMNMFVDKHYSGYISRKLCYVMNSSSTMPLSEPVMSHC